MLYVAAKVHLYVCISILLVQVHKYVVASSKMYWSNKVNYDYNKIFRILAIYKYNITNHNNKKILNDWQRTFQKVTYLKMSINIKG